MPDPLYTGIAVSAHNAKNLETALVSNLSLTERPVAKSVKRVQETSLETLTVATGERKVVYRHKSRFEAPNWSPDGRLFYIIGDGRIWPLPTAGGEPTALNTGIATRCNNDHGLTADGKRLAISSGGGKEGSRIYVVPAAGGDARLVTPEGPSSLARLVARRQNPRRLLRPNGRGTSTSTASPPTGATRGRRSPLPMVSTTAPNRPRRRHDLLPTPERTGVPKIWRMKPDGTGQEQVTSDDEPYADWFPHPSPDGQWLVFLSYDKGVKRHPANQNVVLRLMPRSGGKPKVVATTFGGQGTLNVPSWSPDSKQIAFVSYRYVQEP